MNVLVRVKDVASHSVRALSVLLLSRAAQYVRNISVKLYTRGTLTSIETRFLLNLSSALNSQSIKLLRPPRK